MSVRQAEGMELSIAGGRKEKWARALFGRGLLCCLGVFGGGDLALSPSA